MRCLILELPLPSEAAAPAGSWRHAWLEQMENAAAPTVRTASLDVLPRPDKNTLVVALVPGAALSWHRIELPAGLRRSRQALPAVLAGLLEERLLEDPSQLHLALPAASAQDDRPWVAACQRNWLQQQLQTLQAAGFAVDRIVPEFCPPATGRQAWACGEDPRSGVLWCLDAVQGVWPMPVAALQDADSLALAGPFERLQTEPGLAQWAQERLHPPPVLGTPGVRWLQALHSGWDLAQFDFAQSRATRRWQGLRQALARLWRAPAWRPARWGLAALLLAQLGGLNLWALSARADWQRQHQAQQDIVRNTFSHLSLVIDAPLQMQREVERLRQGSGQLSPRDFEAMLAVLDRHWPASTPPASLRFDGSSLTLDGLNLPAPASEALARALQAEGYRWQAQGQSATLRVQEGAR